MRYIKKAFLSDDYHESGSMVVKCETPREDKEKSELDEIIHESNIYVDASVTIRSCYGEPVSLDFSFSDEKGYAKRLDKIDLMIDMLCEFKRQLGIHWADVKEKGEKSHD